MKIVLVTHGSLGDVQPIIALTLALKNAGHDVLLAGPPEKAEWAKRLGCPYRSFGSDATSFIDGMGNAYTIRSAIQYIGYLRRELRVQFDVFPSIIQGADRVIGSSLVFSLASVSEYMGIPYRFIAFSPQLLPSGYHPIFVFKHHGLPKIFNRILWRVPWVLDQLNMTHVINVHRKKLGLKSIRDMWRCVIGQQTVIASDEAIVPIPPDAKGTAVQTGYLHLDPEAPPLPELDAFLDSGPPPVYAGFGSMPNQDQAKNVPLMVEAARSAGCRLVIGKFWDEPTDFDDAKDVFFIKRFPHKHLFPRMAAVIHHGGSGTTATAALSGVPQVIVPHILDQFYWGYNIHRSGLGPKAVWRSKLTARKLASAIETCLSDESIREKAKTVSKLIRPEESLKRAVRELTK